LGTAAERVNVRTDGVGTVHLLSSVTSGYGSINYASNSGAGWSANTNLATGWYDSGFRSGNYYHQAVMNTSSSAAGYSFIFDLQNWGGSVSWSSENIAASGLPGWPSPGIAYNSAIAIGAGGLSLGTDGHVMAGYVNAGTGYVLSYNGTAWSSLNLGAASDVSVLSDAVGGEFAYYASGGLLKQSLGGAPSENVMINGATVGGYRPLFGYVGAGQSELLYLENTTNKLMSYAVPEPAVFWLISLAGGSFLVLRRPRKIAPMAML
jgi:hypothetical protein